MIRKVVRKFLLAGFACEQTHWKHGNAKKNRWEEAQTQTRGMVEWQRIQDHAVCFTGSAQLTGKLLQ